MSQHAVAERDDDRELIGTIQAARILGIGTHRTARMARDGEIPSVRIGARIYVHRRKLIEWIERQAEQAGER